MAKSPKTVLVSETELERLIQSVAKRKLSNADWELLHALLRAYQFVLDMLKYQKTTLHKLKALLFGSKTEKEASSSKDDDDQDLFPPSSPGDPGPPPEFLLAASSESLESEQPKKEGHGRRGQAFWTKAARIQHTHQSLQTGAPCPKCMAGTLYRYAKPAT